MVGVREIRLSSLLSMYCPPLGIGEVAVSRSCSFNSHGRVSSWQDLKKRDLPANQDWKIDSLFGGRTKAGSMNFVSLRGFAD